MTSMPKANHKNSLQIEQQCFNVKQYKNGYRFIDSVACNFLLNHCTVKGKEGLHALTILEAIPVVKLVPGGFNHARQVSGERPDELQCLAFQVGVWAMC